MASPDQNKANVKAFYDLAFNQRRPEEAVKQYVGSSYRQHNTMAGDGPEPFIGFVKWITGERESAAPRRRNIQRSFNASWPATATGRTCRYPEQTWKAADRLLPSRENGPRPPFSRRNDLRAGRRERLQ